MKKSDAINFFGSQSKLGEALKISQAAISKWPEDVPELRAYQIQHITGGKLIAVKAEIAHSETAA
ncbi:Cro/CI family transcriptional regulator [Shewanella sp. Isolate11]|uniref:Cro/CI family transcriptional regulator n=1 Tax=Shewanella sp. Isolate11 TaxID=2908530 RepID=UPI001EFC3EA5|nr:Cro/CI family transcriptional regulator [Shewanella sp. Isolate11]MCG9697449.1 Cro/CI family transcriptional regulator [Shewanella sp. Isolate11]